MTRALLLAALVLGALPTAAAAGTATHTLRSDAVGAPVRVAVATPDGRRGAPAWERFVLDELLPFLRRRYRVRDDRGGTTVMGTSMGGYGALLLAARRPDVFGRAVSLSGFVQPQRPFTYPGLTAAGLEPERIWGPERGPYLDGHNPTKLVPNLRGVRVYVAARDGAGTGNRPVNEREVLAQAEELVAAARRIGLPVTWRPHAGVHGWPAWRKDVDDVLRWGLSGPLPAAPTSWTHDTVAQVGRAWDVGYRFATPPAVVQRLARDGRMLRGTGRGDVTLRVGGRTYRRALPFTLRLLR